MHRFIYYCFFTVSITGRRVAQKPEIHEDFPGNFTQVVGSEVLLECPIVVNDSFDPPEMLWIEVKRYSIAYTYRTRSIITRGLYSFYPIFLFH